MEIQLQRLVEGVRTVLGSALVGAYLHGSAVLGGWRPRSDLDVIAVSTRGTTAEEKRRLVDLLLALSARVGSVGPPRPIELDVVAESQLRPWRYPPRFDFHYDELLRAEFERGALEPWPTNVSPGLASVVTMALLGERSLYGPPPAAVFERVPRADYLDAILADVPSFAEWLEWDTRNVVLTLPRIWSALATARVHSKESAARWALPQLPGEHRPPLDRALAIYLGEADESWDDLRPSLRPYVDHLVARIKQERPRTRIVRRPT